nr:MAG TPA: hypothetical protein [Caudoviricetes sp.]
MQGSPLHGYMVIVRCWGAKAPFMCLGVEPLVKPTTKHINN